MNWQVTTSGSHTLYSDRLTKKNIIVVILNLNYCPCNWICNGHAGEKTVFAYYLHVCLVVDVCRSQQKYFPLIIAVDPEQFKNLHTKQICTHGVVNLCRLVEFLFEVKPLKSCALQMCVLNDVATLWPEVLGCCEEPWLRDPPDKACWYKTHCSEVHYRGRPFLWLLRFLVVRSPVVLLRRSAKFQLVYTHFTAIVITALNHSTTPPAFFIVPFLLKNQICVTHG